MGRKQGHGGAEDGEPAAVEKQCHTRMQDPMILVTVWSIRAGCYIPARKRFATRAATAHALIHEDSLAHPWRTPGS